MTVDEAFEIFSNMLDEVYKAIDVIDARLNELEQGESDE